MHDEIIQIREIRDDKNGEQEVNSLLEKGWEFISACQVGDVEHMDIVYVVGATKEVLAKESLENSKNPSKIHQFIENSK